MTISEQLSRIQSQIKVEKGEYNSFAKYKYRTIDTILAVAKPILEKEKLSIILSDEVVPIGDRYYVKATAKITNGTDEITSTAYAREPEQKPKFDEAQVTGSASTYARKYALCGLLAIEGEEDPDVQGKQEETPKNDKKVPGEKIENLFKILDTKEKQNAFKAVLTEFKYQKSTDILEKDWVSINKALNEKLKTLQNIQEARDEAPF